MNQVLLRGKNNNQPMKRCATYFFAVFIITISYNTNAISLAGNGNPLKYISGCQLDFNNDGESDIAFLVETLRGRELIVLIKTNKGYIAYQLAKVSSSMHLSCHFGKFVKETAAGKKGKTEGRIYKTPGTYIQLTQPEGSSVVYFWNGSGFTEVWTSD